MSELNLRIANFIKGFSMFIVIGSLLYMYAYASDRLNFLHTSQDLVRELTKVQIFYFGLGIFAFFNLVMNVGISMYKNTKGIDNHSILFKSKEQKESLLMWFTYLWAGINTLIACLAIYVAILKIKEAATAADYLFIPAAGLIILVSIFIGLLGALTRK